MHNDEVQDVRVQDPVDLVVPEVTQFKHFLRRVLPDHADLLTVILEKSRNVVYGR